MSTNKRIIDYLVSGGLFNPEMMEHDKVRDLIVDAHAEILELRDSLKIALDNLVQHNLDYHWITDPSKIAEWRKLLD